MAASPGATGDGGNRGLFLPVRDLAAVGRAEREAGWGLTPGPSCPCEVRLQVEERWADGEERVGLL